jgi:hypothetical protein
VLAGNSELTVLALDLIEQADILDGDDGLVGEGLKQGNLGVAKRAHVGAEDRETTQRLTLAQQRDSRNAVDSWVKSG